MNSPYLAAGRLGDVIAAIQTMATYKFYKMDFEGWADRVSADRSRAEHWKRILEEHPEFFRLDGEKKKASLVWRRQYPKRYSVDTLSEISKDEYDRLDLSAKTRISRVPLSASDIKTLIDTAINLHSRDLEALKQAQWYRPLMFQAAMGIVGALVGSWISLNVKPATSGQQTPSVQAQPQNPPPQR